MEGTSTNLLLKKHVSEDEIIQKANYEYSNSNIPPSPLPAYHHRSNLLDSPTSIDKCQPTPKSRVVFDTGEENLKANASLVVLEKGMGGREGLEMTTPQRPKKLHDMYEDDMKLGSQPSMEIYEKTSPGSPQSPCISSLAKGPFGDSEDG